jgi:hypothetical protein
MIVNVPEHLLWRDDQLCHFPYRLLHVSDLGRPRLILQRQHTVSKSMEVNLKSLRKNGGKRMLLLRCDMTVLRLSL